MMETILLHLTVTIAITSVVLLVVLAAMMVARAIKHERRETEQLENLCRIISIMNPDAPDYDEWKARQK